MTTAHDKHGTVIEPGSTVHFVYGGDHHEAVVEHFHEHHGVHYVEAQISVEVPASSCERKVADEHTTRSQAKEVVTEEAAAADEKHAAPGHRAEKKAPAPASEKKATPAAHKPVEPDHPATHSSPTKPKTQGGK